jgi:hypothetical protein
MTFNIKIGQKKMRIKSVIKKSNFEAFILDKSTISKVVLINIETKNILKIIELKYKVDKLIYFLNHWIAVEAISKTKNNKSISNQSFLKFSNCFETNYM